MGTPSLQQLTELNGFAFQYVCADILRRSGYINVRVNKLCGDNGADIFADNADGSLVIQCKRNRTLTKQDGVLEVTAAKQLYRADHAMIISPARFSQPALQKAVQLGVITIGERQLEKMLIAVYTSDYELNAVIMDCVQQLRKDAKAQKLYSALSTQWGTLPGYKSPPLPTSPAEATLTPSSPRRAIHVQQIESSRKASTAHSKSLTGILFPFVLLLLIAIVCAGLAYKPKPPAISSPIPTNTLALHAGKEDTLPAAESVELIDVENSDSMRQYGYDSESSILIVVLSESSKPNGTWCFFEVPPEVWNTLSTCGHKGDYFWGMVWNNYRHEQIA